MAASKNRGQGPDDHGKMRVRFMEVEIEGSNETLLESIRQITAVTSPRTIVRAVSSPVQALPEAQEAEPPLGSLDSEGAADSDDNAPPDAAVTAHRKTTRPRSTPKRPTLSADLAMDQPPTPLADAVAETKVDGNSPDVDKAVVVATWMRDARQRSSITGPDFYTACVVMDWDPPTDLTSPMRNLKRDGEMDSSEPGKFSLNMKGDKRYRGLRK